MKVYKSNRNLIEFQCAYCNKPETKPLSEYNRNLKLNRENYCSLSCVRAHTNKKHPRPPKNKNFIASFASNQRDEFSPFRITLRNIRRRDPNCNLTLEDLKNVWESQKGICPYTNITLVLPEYNSKLQPMVRASLDRIDSDLGYVKGNVQFVSTLANYMKSNLTHEEVIIFRDTIVKNFCSCYQEDQTISSSVLDVGR